MIHLNFIPFKNQQFEVRIYRTPVSPGALEDKGRKDRYIHRFQNETGQYVPYEISFDHADGFEEIVISNFPHVNLISKAIYNQLVTGLPDQTFIIRRKDNPYNKKVHVKLEEHAKGDKC